MRALVLNLASATERLDFMAGQLDALGLEWERVEAVMPETLDPPATDPVWRRWERPLRVTEMAACASHMKAWERILDLGAPTLILEDDALLDRAVAGLLPQLEAGLLRFDHVSLETRGRKKLLSLDPAVIQGLRRMYLDRTGAAAYVLSPTGAKKLLARATKARGLTDGIICAAQDLVSYQADPALAIQLDQCAAYGLTPPISVSSQIGAVERPAKGGLSFRLRRIKAQLKQGLRHLRHGADRRIVAPAGDWISLSVAPGGTKGAP